MSAESSEKASAPKSIKVLINLETKSFDVSSLESVVSILVCFLSKNY